MSSFIRFTIADLPADAQAAEQEQQQCQRGLDHPAVNTRAGATVGATSGTFEPMATALQSGLNLEPLYEVQTSSPKWHLAELGEGVANCRHTRDRK